MKNPKKAHKISTKEAIIECLDQKLSSNKNLLLMGTGQTVFNLKNKFSSDHVRTTPISEATLIGMSIGAARLGHKIILDLMMANFLYLAFDQIFNQAAQSQTMYGGQIKDHFVCIALTGFNKYGGYQHSNIQNSLFTSSPQIKIICPANAYEAKGLLSAAIEIKEPIIFLIDFGILSQKDLVPVESFDIPINKAQIARSGQDLTIITFGAQVKNSCSVAESLKNELGLEIEIINLRTLAPLDKKIIIQSVRKTKKVLIIEEAIEAYGLSAYISCLIQESCYGFIKQPIKRLTLPNNCSFFTNQDAINERKIIKAVKSFHLKPAK